MTKYELQIEVYKFYKGSLSIEKCIMLYELEYGITPTVEENKKHFVNTSILPKDSTCINEDNLVFMKTLQKSGSVNMFASINVISNILFLTFEEAKILLQFYMDQYQLIYYPENIIR